MVHCPRWLFGEALFRAPTERLVRRESGVPLAEFFNVVKQDGDRCPELARSLRCVAPDRATREDVSKHYRQATACEAITAAIDGGKQPTDRVSLECRPCRQITNPATACRKSLRGF